MCRPPKKIIITFLFVIILFNLKASSDNHSKVQDPRKQQTQNSHADSIITSLISEINPDTIHYFMQTLEDYGTRYALAPNRFEIANWIKDEFIRFGFSDVVLDSFETLIYTTTLQINVIATLHGLERPDDIYISGGHYDATSIYCPTCDQMVVAPGADDNASGTAAVLEIARVMKKLYFQPEATIHFIAFASEETGTITGSEDYAEKAYNSGMNIKLMINNDMIANNTKAMNLSRVNIIGYPEFEDFRDYSVRMTRNYSILEPLNELSNYIGDAAHFVGLGYPAIFFFEDEFSPHYHTDTDLVIYCNMDYCAEVTRASLATLISVMGMPSKIDHLSIIDMGDGQSLLLNWSPPSDPEFEGYHIYLGTESGIYDTTFISQDTSMIVDNLSEGLDYYLGITTYDEDGFESFLIEKSGTPRSLPLSPSRLTDSPLWHEIELHWAPNSEYDLLGYNIYRSTSEEELETKLNPEVVTDTVFTDHTPENGIYYYYTVKAVDNLQNESINNLPIRTRSVSLDQGIVLVDETYDGDGSLLNPTDEETDDFYNSILVRFKKENFDVVEETGISLADLGAFSTVIWHGDDYADLSAPFDARDDIQHYLEFGGNLIYTGYLPSQAFENNVIYPADYAPGDFIYDYLKIASVDKQFGSRFWGAIPVDEGYQEIYTDSNKTKESYNFHLANIEAIEASPLGTVIYSYQTDFDTNTAQGSMQDEPVGVEYIGDDYKVITLSFPLYYMDFAQSKALIENILINKFDEVVSVEDENLSVIPENFILKQNYPNPFNPITRIDYELPAANFVELSIYNLLGQKVVILFSGKQQPGHYSVKWDASGFASGIYFYMLQVGEFRDIRKMILIQ